MAQNQYALQKSVQYFFRRSKDINEENGKPVITLFARLMRETTFDDGLNTYRKAETVWVDIEDVSIAEASEKEKELPNGTQQYKITEKVFRSLYHLSRNKPRELFYVTPFHQESKREKFIT